MLLVLVTSQTTSRIMPLIQVLQRMVMDPAQHLKNTYMLKSVMMITMGMEMMILGITRILIFYFDTTCSDFFFIKVFYGFYSIFL
ncbi:hypothetical protein GW17_00019796 [Ensete ventricosum]|nr:hypothetical protein GW17_00019796 [Ensete ventricosum]